MLRRMLWKQSSNVLLILDSHGNLRGKDFAHKRNAKDGDSSKETTQSTLGTIEYLNKLKKE